MIYGKVEGNAHHPGPAVHLLTELAPVLPQPQKRFIRDLLRDPGIEDDEIDRPHDERMQTSVEGLEGLAVIVCLHHAGCRGRNYLHNGRGGGPFQRPGRLLSQYAG